MKHLSAGTDSSKWNTNQKIGPEVIAALNGLQAENSYEKREEVFEKYRDALTASFK